MESNKSQAIIVSVLTILLAKVYAVPVDPTITSISNTVKASTNGSKLNMTGNDTYYTDRAGGFLFIVNFDTEQQNLRWKAYVGNISAAMTLDDSNNYTIFDWSITSTITGEVYTTRSSGTISWANINCSTAINITNEEIALNHTSNPNDNISMTFNGTDNNGFYVGSVSINADTCPTTNLYVNSSVPANDAFEEVLLHDGSNMIYATVVEDDASGYAVNETFDFQIIVPEVGYDGWTSTTLYYFYSELI